MSRREFGFSYVLSRVLIPVSIAYMYFLVTSLALHNGVLQDFASRSAGYLLPIAIALWLATLAAAVLSKTRVRPLAVIGERVSAADAFLLLLPIAPVTQYLLYNPDFITLSDALVVLALFAGLSAALILVIPALLGPAGATRPVMYLGLAFAFSITNMASLSKQFAWHEWGSLKIQLPVFACVWALSWLLFRLRSRDLLHAGITIYLVANAFLQVSSRGAEAEPGGVLDTTDQEFAAMIGSREPVTTPGIYLLVYDAYVGNETLLAHGIDNAAQEQYLQSRGFKIYPRTYSIGPRSLLSMNVALGLSMRLYGGGTREATSGNGVVQNTLERVGYRTYGVFPSAFYFGNEIPSYDYASPELRPSAGMVVRAILEGEFQFDLIFDDTSQETFMREKRRVLTEASAQPKFLYAHSRQPAHSQDSGACLPDEVEQYQQRLLLANAEMREDVETILKYDPGAIIIVAGDHGPALTKNCYQTGGVYDISEISRLDIQDRYGAFLAIRWPTSGYEDYDDITVLQDVFPVVFAYLYADPRLSEIRVEPVTGSAAGVTSGAQVVDGTIVGGIDDGEPLFLGAPGP